MNNQIEIMDFFRRKIEGATVPYDPQAWVKMKEFLDAEDNKKILPVLNIKWKKILLILLGLCILGSGIFYVIHLFSKPTAALSPSPITESLYNSLNSLIRNTGTNQSGNASAPVETHHMRLPQDLRLPQNMRLPKDMGLSKTGSAFPNDSINPSILNPELTKSKNTISYYIVLSEIKGMDAAFQSGNTTDPGTKITISTRPGRRSNYTSPSIALHFNNLLPLSKYASTGQHAGYGFDLEVFTGNITPNRFTALYLGLNTGLSWMGRSEPTEIFLNTPNNDPGKTYLQNHTADYNALAQVQIGKGPLKFYAHGFGGMRSVFISQRVESKNSIKDFDNTSKNIWSKTFWQWGGGLGIKYNVYHRLSLDLRATYQDAEPINVADVRRSAYDKFNGKYILDYNFIQPRLLSVKVGVTYSFK